MGSQKQLLVDARNQPMAGALFVVVEDRTYQAYQRRCYNPMVLDMLVALYGVDLAVAEVVRIPRDLRRVGNLAHLLVVTMEASQYLEALYMHKGRLTKPGQFRFALERLEQMLGSIERSHACIVEDQVRSYGTIVDLAGVEAA